MMRAIRVAVITVFLLAACGGAAETGTTTATTTQQEGSTTAATGTDDETQVVSSIEDIPQECMDAFVNYLQALETVVQNVDFNRATPSEFEAIGAELEPATATYEQETEGAGCDQIELDVSDEEGFELMIDIAQREAPGTVAYFEWIRDFATSIEEGTGSAASGDCETDIAALQAIVDQGGTMNDLPVAESGTIFGLITSITTACSPERQTEFFAQEDVVAFLGTGG